MQEVHQRTAPESSPSRFPLEQILVLHNALRHNVEEFNSVVRQVGPLTPDAHLVDMEQRLELLQDMVLGHCIAEDDVVIPALAQKPSAQNLQPASSTLCTKATTKGDNLRDTSRALRTSTSHGTSTSTDSDQRTTKRCRRSPVSVNLQPCLEDHVALTERFRSVKDALVRARSTPIVCTNHGASAPGLRSPTSPAPQYADKTDNCLRRPARRDVAPSWIATRRQMLAQVRDETCHLIKSILTHLDNEEREMLPMCGRLLSADEQGVLLVKTLLASATTPQWAQTFGHMVVSDLIALFKDVAHYASDTDLSQIASAACPFVAPEAWKLVVDSVPKLSRFQGPPQNRLVELLNIHSAIRSELRDLIQYCSYFDITSRMQVQSLSSRFEFLLEVYRYHSEGEQNGLVEELNSKLNASSGPGPGEALPDVSNGKPELELAAALSKRLTRYGIQIRRDQFDIRGSAEKKTGVLKDLRCVAESITSQMNREENGLYPLVERCFTLSEQDKVMGMIMSKIPLHLLREVMPWMFSLLSVSDLEAGLRNLLRRASADEIRTIVLSVVTGVQKGMTDGRTWAELCLRLPKLKAEAEAVDKQQKRERVGPVSEILRVHKAIRVDLNALLRRTRALPADGRLPNPRTLGSIAANVAFLRRMVTDHSKAEDEILLPRIEARAPGSEDSFIDEHTDERNLFAALAKCLEALQCETEASGSSRLVRQLQVITRTLQDAMVFHLRREEEQIWPLVTTLFTSEEQSRIVALIFGHMPGDRLRELLPWMIRVLSVAERNEMIEHILQITRSTMFEKWLRTWLPLDDDGTSDFEPSDVAAGSARVMTSGTPNQGSGVNIHPNSLPASVESATRTIVRYGRDSLEKVIREIARDESIAMENRARLMQEVMLAPFTQRQEVRTVTTNRTTVQKDNLEPTYTKDSKGRTRLGCAHYLRAVKLRAACCGRLYTCRLCHDDAEKTHVLDRYSTTEILCMRCTTLQPVSDRCANVKCGKVFAHYFCAVCKIYDDDASRSVYHCPSCNVCRVGKGLGIDFFHCMKCNQCMNKKYQNGHVCVENAMESDCPVCYEYLFTSTAPVKYLQCGHLMHASCYKTYRQKQIRCPVCAKSLEEMIPVYKRLDHLLTREDGQSPNGDKGAQCELFCHDCNSRSVAPFHFVFHRCRHCSSYNTRVERVTPGQ